MGKNPPNVVRYRGQTLFHQLLAVGRWFPPGTPVSYMCLGMAGLLVRLVLQGLPTCTGMEVETFLQTEAEEPRLVGIG